MTGSFDLLVTVVLLSFTVMLWKASSHPLTSRPVRITMRIVVALIASLLLWNLVTS